MSEEMGVDGGDDDFLWCWDFNRRRCSGDGGCLTTVTLFFFFHIISLLFLRYKK